jgi:hypothetical protein
MASVWSSFRDCGWASFVILFLTVVALMNAVAAAVAVFGSKNRSLAVALSATTVCLGVAIFGIGEYGKLRGESTVDRVLAELVASGTMEASRSKEIRDEGYLEAAQCVSVGIGGSALPLIFGLALITAAVMKKKEPTDSDASRPA